MNPDFARCPLYFVLERQGVDRWKACVPNSVISAFGATAEEAVAAYVAQLPVEIVPEIVAELDPVPHVPAPAVTDPVE